MDARRVSHIHGDRPLRKRSRQAFQPEPCHENGMTMSDKPRSTDDRSAPAEIVRLAVVMLAIAVSAVVVLVLLSAWPAIAGTAAAGVGQIGVIAAAIATMATVAVSYSRRRSPPEHGD